MSKEGKILIAVAGVVVVVGVLLAIFANPQPDQPGQSVDPQSLVRDSSHMTGKKDAKVTIVEFGDFQCPACGAAFPVVEQVLSSYKDNPEVNFVFRNFPLESIHPNARIGSEAAEAAGDQGKFWEMYRKLYEKQAEWSSQLAPLDTLVGYAGELGLDTGKFRTYITQHLATDIIDADIKDGENLTINSTPTFFINGEINRKILSLEEFKTKIDAGLAK